MIKPLDARLEALVLRLPALLNAARRTDDVRKAKRFQNVAIRMARISRQAGRTDVRTKYADSYKARAVERMMKRLHC